MEKKPEEYLKEPYSRVLLPEEDGRFSAEILEFPGCFAQGDNPNEAFNNLEAAAKSWIQASLDQGLEIPPPAMNIGYSGKIALRIPRSLHKRAAQFADRDGTSLNQFLISAIASKTGAEEYHSFLCQKFEQKLTYTITNNYLIQGAQGNLFVLHGQPFLAEAYNREVLVNGRGTQLCIQS
jgi:predicted RNase H-like HicB family nuclease